ncbi:zinc-binding alcohol dehydrogenase domain-containing protein cipb [Diplodia corticola]|uniref:Zinc-binding alcohol dehydrogenase domain-containing protein cipb n=1 Tax=Diplodia corticola TaxID=236234 RepID=A0A1J9RM29_9PEZI|nr:zinc-binding alcohol dehydrogenase domain-containing protein cipb [Diplodia corticola]OJD28653.1 zinc-binding alcohol dehydrogenase domain-containing protein cipb [Diplodia corticola]
MSTHLAAVLPAKGSTIEVKDRPTPTPGPSELLINVKSVAVNPLDWKQQLSGFMLNQGFPTVLGSDVSGIVLAAGSAVPADAPKPGTRVAAFAPCFFTQGAADYGAFQTRVLVPAANAVALPERVDFDEASTLPMAVATAWSGLYTLGVPRETAFKHVDKQAFLVWGGASSIGTATIQLASSMGFSVYATASEKHHDYLRTLGAKRLFDYRNGAVVEDIIRTAREDDVTLQLGFDAVGALESCLQVLKKLNPRGAKLASAPPLTPDSPQMEGVELKFVSAPNDPDKLADFFRFVFGVWLKKKLDAEEFIPSPKVKVIGGGLHSVQAALNESKAGVSGVKLVLQL